MLFGGSRSGKTFLLVRAVIARALKAPKSRHAILRFRFAHVKQSIAYDTLPKVMELCFPSIPLDLNKTDWFVKLPNGSEIWLGGLDDKERTEKILGQEYATIYLNEVSQIPYGSVGIARTRLAQKVTQTIEGMDDAPLRPRMLYDCNPPSKAHWAYKLFVQHRDPETDQNLTATNDYVSILMNPADNAANLPPEYIGQLQALPPRLRKRFHDGEFADATPNALFRDETIDLWRQTETPQLIRVVVGVDPSGSGDADNADNDQIGIVVAGLGIDGNAYVLQDCTVKAGPATWGSVAASAYDRHMANVIVGEVNYGGAMVQHVIKTAHPKASFKQVSASRGKAVRAEPFSALYEQGKVRHVGRFPELEDEMCAFSTYGYTGGSSPNRADALVWALTELFPGITKAPAAPKPAQSPRAPALMQSGGWMT
ncbi:MAG TPA: phage terminase large subunit [Rhodopila sp.]|nr:phage terminase large subunit [Rhodopila sp.]